MADTPGSFAPTPRTPRPEGTASGAAEVAASTERAFDDLVAEVFAALAGARGAVSLAAFEDWWRSTAPLFRSETPVDLTSLLGKIDPAGGSRVEKGEFVRLLRGMADLVGHDKMKSVLATTSSELRSENAAAANGAASTLNAAVPLGARKADREDSLETRGRVLERMLSYFSGLQESYNAQLREVQEARQQLLQQQSEEERQAREAPPPPRLFARFAPPEEEQVLKPATIPDDLKFPKETSSVKKLDAKAKRAAKDDTDESADDEEEDEDDENEDEDEDEDDDEDEEEESEDADDESVEDEDDETEESPRKPRGKTKQKRKVVIVGAEKKVTAKAKSAALEGAAVEVKPSVEPFAASPTVEDAAASEQPVSVDAPAAQVLADAPAVASEVKKPGKVTASRRPKYSDDDGVQCVQTLEMGLAVRCAICRGDEVWTVDWAGNVSIRAREDPSQVHCEVPTHKFVWSMMYMEPGLMLMGQESQGVAIFDAKTKEHKGALTSGHAGGICCLASEDSITDVDEHLGDLPTRRVWSGSNDFTIRVWDVMTWRAGEPTPKSCEGNKVVVVNVGQYKVGFTRGPQLHGHKNGVRSLLRIGPVLWSGSDDGSIRLWRCSDGSCVEAVEGAHNGSVLRLAVVRVFVWSAGSDGVIKEWSIQGNRRECLRKVAPEGCEKSVYAIVPVGQDVWTCGHHPSIQMLSQRSLLTQSEHWAHDPWVSNILAVDRVEVRIMWSTSLGDKKLKVWRHTIRGGNISVDELRAANRLFEREGGTYGERLKSYVRRNSLLEDEVSCSAEEYRRQLDTLMQDFGRAREEADALKEQNKYFKDEIAGLKSIFESAGLGHLMENPEAMQAFLKRAALLEQALRDAGLSEFLDNPDELRRMLNAMKQLKEIAEKQGFGNLFEDPARLGDMLSHYAQMQKVFQECGLPELFEDPYTLRNFLQNYNKIREAFRNAGIEYLLDSAGAMRDFLTKKAEGDSDHREAQERISKLEEELRAKAASLEAAEKRASDLAAKLKQSTAESDRVRERLAAYESLGDLESLRNWKNDAAEMKRLRQERADYDERMSSMKNELERKEQERQEALERERIMALKYKELDIFKLDIIARELKALDSELGLAGKEVKSLQQDTGRLKNYDEQQQIGLHGSKLLDQCHALRAHIRDVINKCLSETQKLHVGIAIDDHLAAGELKDGGVMAGWVCEEIDAPDYGSSKAGKLRQGDEMARDRRMHPETLRKREELPRLSSPQPGALPKIASGRSSPVDR
eukprot:TRINITY_DN54230_c0_g1_i1.p1 TRINITY_DN54230_c0_g1~~TRINITY_DN54230_c0_g1_i1.p1  ORF type:complete len:1256 (+),score=298.71 TRINITY_DN54230_c0_g1_i1:59-3826(+)